MRTSAQGPLYQSSSFVVVSSWRCPAVFVASAGMMMIGARTTALAQRAELAEPEFEERVNLATRHSAGAHTIHALSEARGDAPGAVQFPPFNCGYHSAEEVRIAFGQAVQRGEVVDPTKRAAVRSRLKLNAPCAANPSAAVTTR